MKNLLFSILAGSSIAGLLHIAGLSIDDPWWWVLCIGLNGIANIVYFELKNKQI